MKLPKQSVPVERNSGELIDKSELPGSGLFPSAARGGSGQAGGKCKVTSGSNAGKTGTYTEDGEGLWCEGDWGGTQCTDSQGNSNGKCSNARQWMGGLGTVDDFGSRELRVFFAPSRPRFRFRSPGFFRFF